MLEHPRELALLNGSGIEVMIRTGTSGTSGKGGKGGKGGKPVYSFERTGNETSGSMNILGLMKWERHAGGRHRHPSTRRPRADTTSAPL
ncbi:hypothetical protein KGA66_11840 [Actinocrinis puniceicyclus]|uniref:Uncharacterized protein n=1 Tax=Actinocrinis puniceicyclus TaxID=977794 RepID=A0A8J8BEH2_9ACTN|nr:hypothetical protein [Actinocrinis puniceicyclus]MBS2963744.1 hypothetical protein [Actinocrinis puniceicyclus]